MNITTPFPWSEPGKIEQLEKLYKDGLSCSQIAAIMSTASHTLTRNAVIGKAHRLGLTEDHRRPASGPSSLSGLAAKAKGARRVTHPVARIQTVKSSKPLPILVTVPSLNARPWEERTSRQCNWPVERTEPGIWYCCDPTPVGRNWCNFHWRLGHSQPASPEEKQRAIKAAERMGRKWA